MEVLLTFFALSPDFRQNTVLIHDIVAPSSLSLVRQTFLCSPNNYLMTLNPVFKTADPH
jgi:hypothetical protein